MTGINASVSGYAPFTNTDTDSVDTTDSPYVSIRSIRSGSVNASAVSGTVRIVFGRSEEKFKIQARRKKTYLSIMQRIYPYLSRILAVSHPIITQSKPS